MHTFFSRNVGAHYTWILFSKNFSYYIKPVHNMQIIKEIRLICVSLPIKVRIIIIFFTSWLASLRLKTGSN
jgi:hypothetical protein